mmetsp:Transcript_73038/g.141315  ORF Transcript_73038/g.141315 Transcript_73038/m.141315 type:complete len:107 (-) Transcript_73038:62-382(-)
MLIYVLQCESLHQRIKGPAFCKDPDQQLLHLKQVRDAPSCWCLSRLYPTARATNKALHPFLVLCTACTRLPLPLNLLTAAYICRSRPMLSLVLQPERRLQHLRQQQ